MFALIVRVHPYCARYSCRMRMLHHALSACTEEDTGQINIVLGGCCVNFAWSVTHKFVLVNHFLCQSSADFDFSTCAPSNPAIIIGARLRKCRP